MFHLDQRLDKLIFYVHNTPKIASVFRYPSSCKTRPILMFSSQATSSREGITPKIRLLYFYH